MLKAIVFDFDGVLIDSEPLMRFAFESCYRRRGLPGEPPTEAYLEHMGAPFPRIMDHLGLPRDLWEPYKALCRAHLDLVALFPEAPGLLRLARRLGLDLALLTGKDRMRTLETLDHFDLARYFRLVVASDELRRPKPDPEGILRILDELGVEAHEAVMVGDAVNDVRCAQAAGVTAVAVTWGTKPERLSLCDPDHLVDDWDSLAGLLLAMCRPAIPVEATATATSAVSAAP